MTQLVFILAVFAVCPYLIDGRFSCRTPTCGTCHCVDIDQCPPLLFKLNKPFKTYEDFEEVRRYQCGFNGNNPKVCCPQVKPTVSRIECVTPEGTAGKCISVYSCSYINMLLQRPMTYAVRTYIRNSRCNGPQRESVCCAEQTPLTTEIIPTSPQVCTPSAYPPQPHTGCCGMDGGNSNKIFGGIEAAIDEYPWLVIIEYKQGSQIKLLCGGVLISGRYVLTAAHCVAGPVLSNGIPINVRLGEYDISNNGPDCVAAEGGGTDCTPGALIVPIEKIISHPAYNPSNQLRRNDIALIRLNRMAPYTDFIRPICLPTTDMTINPDPDTELYTAGWGAVDMQTSSNNIKLFVDLPLVPLNTCDAVYSSRFNVPLWKGQLCAGGEQGKDSCKGDSGGPLMYQNGRTYEVIGVVSFGPTPCAQQNIPGVYTKVYEYLPWIRSQIKP